MYIVVVGTSGHLYDNQHTIIGITFTSAPKSPRFPQRLTVDDRLLLIRNCRFPTDGCLLQQSSQRLNMVKTSTYRPFNGPMNLIAKQVWLLPPGDRPVWWPDLNKHTQPVPSTLSPAPFSSSSTLKHLPYMHVPQLIRCKTRHGRRHKHNPTGNNLVLSIPT